LKFPSGAILAGRSFTPHSTRFLATEGPLECRRRAPLARQERSSWARRKSHRLTAARRIAEPASATPVGPLADGGGGGDRAGHVPVGLQPRGDDGGPAVVPGGSGAGGRGSGADRGGGRLPGEPVEAGRRGAGAPGAAQAALGGAGLPADG